MSLTIFLIVLVAAAMHAGWNAFVKLRLEPILAMTLISLTAGLFAFPALLMTGLPRIEAWPWLVASLIFHLGYYIGLAEAYRRAEMSQIYPLARGGAPLLTTAVGVAFFGERLAPLQLGAIGLLGIGIMLISILGRRRGSAFDPVALGFAALAAVMISGYTLVDGLGARAARILMRTRQRCSSSTPFRCSPMSPCGAGRKVWRRCAHSGCRARPAAPWPSAPIGSRSGR